MQDNPLVTAIIEWLTEKKAKQINVYHIEKSSGYTDYAIVCEGNADTHIRAIANNVLDNVKTYGLAVLSKEGIEYAHWALIDLGEVIVHIFLPSIRQIYHIDELFGKLSQQESTKPVSTDEANIGSLEPADTLSNTTKESQS